MSGLELGLAVVEVVTLTGKAFLLIARIKENVGLAKRNDTFASSLSSNLQSLKEYFEDKQKYTDEQLNLASRAWKSEIPKLLREVEECCEDLHVLAGTPKGRKIFVRVKRRILAVATAEAASTELRFVDLKIRAIRNTLLVLDTGNLVCLHADRVRQQIEEFRTYHEGLASMFMHATKNQKLETNTTGPASHLSATDVPLGASAVEGTRSSSGASGSTSPSASSAVLSRQNDFGTSHAHAEADYGASREKVEDMFPEAERFLRRLEENRLQTGMTKEDYDGLRVVFKELWSPWQIDAALLRSTGKMPRILGRGSYGNVYEYKLRISVKRAVKVAVKIFDPVVCRDEFYADFFREASLMYKLRHPCIVKFYGARWPSLPGSVQEAADKSGVGSSEEDSSEDGDGDGSGGEDTGRLEEAMLVMEKLDGNVAELIDKGKLSKVEDVIKVLADAAKGLAFMHGSGYTHLDVKPENILARVYEGRLQGRGKLADFGISQQKRDKMTTLVITSGGSTLGLPKAVGTPSFMAPELYTSSPGYGRSRMGDTSGSPAPHSVSPFAADVYAFGVTVIVLFRFISEKQHVAVPECFRLGQDAIRSAAEAGRLTSEVSEWGREVLKGKPGLLNIVLGCIRADPEDRPPMVDVLDEMGRVLADGSAAPTRQTRANSTHPGRGSSPQRLRQRFEPFKGRKFLPMEVEGQDKDQNGNDMKSKGISCRIEEMEDHQIMLQMRETALHIREAVRRQHSTTAQRQAQLYRRGDMANGVKQNMLKAVDLFRGASENGNTDAVCALGRMHEYGLGGLVRDEEEAMKLYRQAADVGNTRGIFDLGTMYVYGGGGVAKDEAEAMSLFRQAARGGNLLATFKLGEMYSAEGRSARANDERNEFDAVRLFQEAGGGDADAACNLGMMNFRGGGSLVQNKVRAVRLFWLAADAGSARAAFFLGHMYENGEGGLQPSMVEAKLLYRFAAEDEEVAELIRMEGSDLAKEAGIPDQEVYNEGNRYRIAEGVRKDEVKAVELFRRAAEFGNPDAAYALAMMIKHGRGGLARNDEEALRLLWQAAADGGNLKAVIHLAWMYESGWRGVLKDKLEAARLFQRAGGWHTSHMSSAHRDDMLYRNGLSEFPHGVELVRLSQQAAAEGNVYAYYELGELYELGQCGLLKNSAEAEQYYRLAATHEALGTSMREPGQHPRRSMMAHRIAQESLFNGYVNC